MFNTVNTKAQQLSNTYFSVGSGGKVILIMGSCRTVPYVNYFYEWNMRNGNQFIINFIDPFSWNWDAEDNRVDYNEALEKLESDERLLSMLKSVNIFIHEYYQNAGMFNVNKEDAKTIYKFGMAPQQDICIPNFNDLFILAGDIVSFDLEIRKKAIQDYNVIGKLSEQTQKEIFDISRSNIAKFIGICFKSDLWEMAECFLSEYRSRRFYWTHNHVSKEFTLQIFYLLLGKMKLDYTTEFWNAISLDDLFANNYTYITEYDILFYQYAWNEEIKPLRSKL